MKLATAAQMKETDRVAIEERGMPSLELMERAAEGVAAAALELAEETAPRCENAQGQREKMRFLPEVQGEVIVGDDRAAYVKNNSGPYRAAVFVGPGNNGGDGVAAARLLAAQGWEVRVFLVGDRAKLTPDNAAMTARLGEARLTLEDYPSRPDAPFLAWCAACDVLIDALFGVGLCREVGGLYAVAIAQMNASGVPVVAADIASGLSADTGEVLGIAVRAAVTVTFSMAKTGQFVDQGSLYTGKLIVHDIGIPEDIAAAQAWETKTIDRAFVRSALPRRKPDGHKGNFGKDYILAGSVGFTGAPVFAAKACVRTGAGLVTVGTPEAAWPVVAGKCLEEMVQPLPEHGGKLSAAARGSILQQTEHCDAVLLGPGLGRSEESDALICTLAETLPQPLVLDADGINAISAHIDVFVLRRRAEAGYVTVLTPHDGEFARLGGDLAQGGRFAAARRFARQYGCVLVLKGHRTIVAAPDGRAAVNTTGNSGMAKGGSGDVLAGMILSLLGQGADAFDAASAAVWLHGRAGDLAAAELGEYAMTPSDLLTKIAGAIREISPAGT